MQNKNDKHAQYSTNPAYIVKYQAGGAVRVKNPNFDPKACSKCGKRHGIFQGSCK